MSAKISVILPVYNVDQWISQTIQSLRAQTFQEWEAIFVIDGSEDSSENIVRFHMETDSRLKIITQSNKGQGAARDLGVEIAMGEYIFFLDPDDMIPPSALTNAYARAISTGADIIVGDYIEFKDGSDPNLIDRHASELFHRHFSQYNQLFYRNDITDLRFFYHGLYFMVVWMKLFKRDTWLKNSIKAPVGLTMGEDFMTVKKMLFLNSSVTALDSVLVYYRKRPNSSTTLRSEKAFDIFASFNFTRDMYRELSLDEIEIANMHAAYLDWFYTHLIKFTPYSKMYQFYKEICRYRDVFLSNDARLGALGTSHVVAFKATVLPGPLGFTAWLIILGSKDLVKVVIIWCVKLFSLLLPKLLHGKFEAFLIRIADQFKNRRSLQNFALQLHHHFKRQSNDKD